MVGLLPPVMAPSCGRIVEYKFSFRLTLQVDELFLVSKALHGLQLPLPLCSFNPLMTIPLVDRLSSISLPSVVARYLRPLQKELMRSTSFSRSFLDKTEDLHMRQTSRRNCQFSLARIFWHFPSKSGSYRLPLARMYRQVRKQKVVND